MARKPPPARKRGTPKTGGRKKGTPNKVTTEAKEAANALVDDPKYRRKLQTDLRKRKVHPAIEQMLWHYAKGKPKETIEHQGSIEHVTRKIEDETKRLPQSQLEELVPLAEQLLSKMKPKDREA